MKNNPEPVHAETLWQTASDVSTNEKEKIPPSKWQRFKQNKTRMAIVIGMVVLAVVAAIAVPLVMMSMEKRFIDQNKVLPPPPKVDEKIQDPDAVRPNNFTPPLNEPFPYGKQPIRGINLGGWLVLEPFITPHVFENSVTNGTVKDEWELCERLGPDKAKETLENHYKSFITEEDFKKMAEMGFNHVRIPLGHWSVRVFPGEPFVPHVSWDYLLKGLEWARKYGLRVMVELHTAPGSQNGWNHSGREGKVGWLDGTKQGETYAQDTVGVVSQIVEYFNKPQYANVVTLFGVLNEPAMMKIPKKRVRSWYDTSYKAIRKILGYGKGPLLTYHDGFAPLEEWEGFFTKDYERVILETHLYLSFDDYLVKLPRQKQLEFPCKIWKPSIKAAGAKVGLTMVGEFSIATNDCGKFLNGVGTGARFDGTLEPLEEGVSPPGTCVDQDNWRNYTSEYNQFLKTFMEKQMDSYEGSIGWFYWTYKTQDHINPLWDYLLAYEQGWAPKDANVRDTHCPAVTSNKIKEEEEEAE